MANPEGSEFGNLCSLPDDTEAAEDTERQMANPEGSEFGNLCSLPDGREERNRERKNREKEVVREYVMCGRRSRG
jgi:putative hemolysin